MPSRAPIATSAIVALAVQIGGACGCGHYEEPATDLTAMPQRPEVAPPAENGFGIIAGEVRQESLAASVAVAFETVGLFRDGKLLATSTTDGHGRFRFDRGEAKLYDDGFYQLTLLSDRYRGSARIQYAQYSKRSYLLTAEPRGRP
jgi:hypothetical protein